MRINKRAIDLIKEFEGLELEAYADPVGIITIGYGTTAAAGVGITPRLGMKITEEEAEMYLARALDKLSDKIIPKITAPITENQFGAFMSLAYNIGLGRFSRSSALRHFNAGDVGRAANSILLFNKARGKVFKGLQRRRAAERVLFLTAPSAIKPPERLQRPGKGGLAGIIKAIIAAIGAAFGIRQ